MEVLSSSFVSFKLAFYYSKQQIERAAGCSAICIIYIRENQSSPDALAHHQD